MGEPSEADPAGVLKAKRCKECLRDEMYIKIRLVKKKKLTMVKSISCIIIFRSGGSLDTVLDTIFKER